MAKKRFPSYRPNIELSMKREIRKRCGYGCVICGNPIIRYHHIVPWSECKEHQAENITLLCPQHHDEHHAKLISRSQIIEADKAPFAKESGFTSPLKLRYADKPITVKTKFHEIFAPWHPSEPFIFLSIDSLVLILLHQEDDRVLISCQLHDRNNNQVVVILDNEVILSSASEDVEVTANRIVIKHSDGVRIDFEFEPPNIFTIGGFIFFNGLMLDLDRMLPMGDHANSRFTRIGHPLPVHPDELKIPRIAYAFGDVMFNAKIHYQMRYIDRYALSASEVQAMLRKKRKEPHGYQFMPGTILMNLSSGPRRRDRGA